MTFSPLDFALLWLACLATAMVSGSVGLLGGTLLMGVMTLFYAPVALIPVHGAVQLASNLTRVAINFSHVHRRIALKFLVGAVVGGWAASRVVIALDPRAYALTIGVLMLVMTWIPAPPALPRMPGKFVWIGTGITFLSFFTGAVGPFLAPFILREELNKERTIATIAACQSIQHLAKVVAFGAMGFAYREHAVELGAMIVAAVIGNYVGRWVLRRIPERAFRVLLKVVVTALAARMLASAV